MILVFHKLHITANTVGVQSSALSLKRVFKRYTQ